MKLKQILILLAFGLMSGTTAMAAETPTSLKGATVVDAAKVKSLQDGGAVIVDTRAKAEYVEGHIKGAISVPYKEKSAKAVDYDADKDKFDLSELPADKSKAIVSYCNGSSCWKSYKGATAMVKAGYANVYWFRDGFPEWKAKGMLVE